MRGFIRWGGVRGFIQGGMHGFIWGCAWFYSGGHVWFYLGGMHGFIRGACVVLFGGACMVFPGGCAWFFSFFGYNEIWSMSGRYASYWNAFLLLVMITDFKKKSPLFYDYDICNLQQ